MVKQTVMCAATIAILSIAIRPGLNPSVYNKAPGPAKVSIVMPPPANQVFRRACQDCHSNQTAWPWYSQIPPLSFAIAADVIRGRAVFNMSEWNAYSNGRKRGFLSAIAIDAARDHMPPRSYRWLHPESRLSGPDRFVLAQWATQERARLRASSLATPGSVAAR